MTAVQQRKRDQFVNTFNDLFDVTHADALTMIKIAEDREFLIAQREKGRRGCMGPIDRKLTQIENRRRAREQLHVARRSKETSRCMNEKEILEISDSSSEDSVVVSSSDDYSTVGTSSDMPTVVTKKKRPSSFVNSDISSALDRSRVSDRNAVYVLSATAQAVGQDPREFAINRESIRQARRQHRKTIANEIRASFNHDVALTVHWDGKMLPSLMANNPVDRLAVLVSGAGIMKLLGVPVIPSSTGEAQAAAVYSLLQDWNLTNRVQLMSFDTTASNTGRKGGACILLEQKLQRKLVSLPCRYHIMELIIAAVFGLLMEKSSGPDIKLFKRFAECWGSIDRQSYESGVADEAVAQQLDSAKADLLTFIHNQLSQFQPRDDYKELLQLSLLFLGEALPAGVMIQQPGACHRARWMAKVIYSLKIYLFRSQFHLTSNELAGLTRFNVFVMNVYLEAWYTCPLPTSAPRNDLALLRKLERYKTVDESVAKAAIKSFTGHLWYINEVLVGLAFFDSEVNSDTKVDMVTALQRNTSDDPPQRIAFEENRTAGYELPYFVSVNTRKLFVSLGINQTFLDEDPATWNTNDDYFQAQAATQKLKVVNDAAERGIALCQTFNAVLTKHEDQKQFLLQVVEKHRLEFPNANKSTVVGGRATH
jgi:hypothetical protein